ncbi:unnamed protein product [Vicia faba]|uniref:Uncharacterized protein n=1 Tax=Vicia faba TaxID=3906 RepID=A0AAV0YDI2_VICFA|nr:unnamed protein product [Vicia faba]
MVDVQDLSGGWLQIEVHRTVASKVLVRSCMSMAGLRGREAESVVGHGWKHRAVAVDGVVLIFFFLLFDVQNFFDCCCVLKRVNQFASLVIACGTKLRTLNQSLQHQHEKETCKKKSLNHLQ